jgi:hypothetical protein
MEKVVYILGARFSAPLGLPVVSNFLQKSKDLYFANPDRYKHFKEVFDTIRSMHVAKSYYETNLFNIEEILSILEMSEQLGNENERKSFVEYIVDVIEACTPQPLEFKGLPGNWSDYLFGESSNNSGYGYFVGSLLNLYFSKNGLEFKRSPKQSAGYSVITLNYDLYLRTTFST